MSLQLSQNLVVFLFLFAIGCVFLASWWGAHLVSKQMDNKLIASMQNAWEKSAEISRVSADTCAEAARAMIQGMRATSIVLEQTSDFATSNSPKDTLDKVLAGQFAANAPTDNHVPGNGRWKPQPMPARTQPIEVDPDSPRDGIKLPGDM